MTDQQIRAELFSKHFGEDLIDYHAKEPGSNTCIKHYRDGTKCEFEETKAERQIWRYLPDYFKDRRDHEKMKAYQSEQLPNYFGDSK